MDEITVVSFIYINYITGPERLIDVDEIILNETLILLVKFIF